MRSARSRSALPLPSRRRDAVHTMLCVPSPVVPAMKLLSHLFRAGHFVILAFFVLCACGLANA